MKYKFAVIIEKDEDRFSAYVPALENYTMFADTYEELIENMEDAIKRFLEFMIKNNREIPNSDVVDTMIIEVEI